MAHDLTPNDHPDNPLRPLPEEDGLDLVLALALKPEDIASARAPPDQELPPDAAWHSLQDAEDLVHRARMLSDAVFKAARRWPEYKRVLATRERCQQFEDTLQFEAFLIDGRLNTRLPNNVLDVVVVRLANRIAAWEHSPKRQRVRQKLQVTARRRRNRGRDLQIVRYYENGESQRKVAARFGISRNAVRNVLRRDLPRPPEQSESVG